MKMHSFFSKTIATIELLQFSENSCRYVLCFFEWKSQQLRLLDHVNGDSSSELQQALMKIETCIWIINDDSVLNKALNSASKNSGLSNMKWSDFYASTGESILSLSRISDVLRHQNSIQNIKKHPSSIFLGLSPLESVLKLLPEKVELTRHSIVHKAEQVQLLESNKKALGSQTLLLDGEEYPSEAVLGFAAAVRFLKDHSLSMGAAFSLPVLEAELNSNDIERSVISFRNSNITAFRSFYNQLFFKTLLRFNAILMGVLLLLGFSIQTYKQHVFEDDRNLQATAQTINESFRKISKSIDAKRNIYELMKQNKQHNVALLVDSLLVQIPNTITLTELTYQPKKRKNTAFSQEDILPNQFFIQGNMSQKDAFSTWKSYLESLIWVDQIAALELSGSADKSLQFEFVIELKNE